MKTPYVLSVLMLTVVFAGCFGDEPAPDADGETPPEFQAPVPPDAPDFDWASAIHVTHPEGIAGHAVPGSHKGLVGMEFRSFYDLSAGMRYQALVSGQYNEVDICGDFAVVGSFAGNRGFTLVNLTNTSDIQASAQFASNSLNWDVRFSPDCQLVFVGMENVGAVPAGTPTFPAAPTTGVVGDTFSAIGDTGRGGVIVVDVSRESYPKRLSYVETGTVHNLFSYEVANETYVIINTGAILKLVGAGDERTLEKVAEVPGSHDIHVAAHPNTGHPYLFTGQEGLGIYDFADPTAPELVANLEFPAGHSMWHEQTPAPAMLDGRWVIVGAGENQGGMPEPFSIVDITDPSEPAFLGSWTLPGEFGAHDPNTAFYTFSPHNVAIRDDGRVALANYHAGSWVIDISTKERQETPVTLGFTLPDQAANGIVRSLPYSPYVWGGVWAADGSLVIADLNTGLYSYTVP